MIDYLAQKDIYPISSKQNIFWFLSPFRNEKTASFKVDNSSNRFYDFGEGFGGTLIDLISKLENISIKEIIQKFNNNSFSNAFISSNFPSPYKLVLFSIAAKGAQLFG